MYQIAEHTILMLELVTIQRAYHKDTILSIDLFQVVLLEIAVYKAVYGIGQWLHAT